MFGEHWEFYLDTLLGPVATQAVRLLDRIGITVVEENKLPEGVSTAFEKECARWPVSLGLRSCWGVDSSFRTHALACSRTLHPASR